MTHLLQQAFTEIQKLPADQQDAIATRILSELKDEQLWTARFDATTDEQWDRLAQAARREIDASETTAFDDVFPVNPS
ncbi:MAG: hypothetical protein J4F39_06210 [Candidatus Latescibacteria bacterium]|nr:hypothetical protein [Candidatus Latescibacterota bacterium]